MNNMSSDQKQCGKLKLFRDTYSRRVNNSTTDSQSEQTSERGLTIRTDGQWFMFNSTIENQKHDNKKSSSFQYDSDRATGGHCYINFNIHDELQNDIMPHNEGNCYLADMDQIDKHCNENHVEYTGIGGYKAQNIRPPTIKDDGTIDYDGLEGEPACNSLYGITKVWNDMVERRNLGNLNLDGGSQFPQNLSGLLLLREACGNAEIGWDECTETKLTSLDNEKMRQVLEDTLQTNVIATGILEQQAAEMQAGTLALQQSNIQAQQANEIAAGYASIDLDYSKSDDYEDDTILYIAGGGIALTLCFCIILLVLMTKKST